MKKNLFMIVLLILCAAPAILQAASYHWEDAQVSITIPENWTQKFEDGSDESGDTLIVTAPNGAMSLLFFVLEADEMDNAIDQVEKDLNATFDDLEFNEDTEDFTINGMPAFSLSGKAEKGKIDVEINLVITPAAKCLTILSIAGPDVFKKYEKDIISIVKGIEPIEEEDDEEEEE